MVAIRELPAMTLGCVWYSMSLCVHVHKLVLKLKIKTFSHLLIIACLFQHNASNGENGLQQIVSMYM